MISRSRLVAEIALPGIEGKVMRSWPFPLETPISFGHSPQSAVKVPSAQAEEVEIEIENDYSRRGGVEVHSFTTATLEAEGRELPFGKDAPRFVTLSHRPVVLKFKGVEAWLSLSDQVDSVDEDDRQLDSLVNRVHQEIAQEDLDDEVLAAEIERRCDRLQQDTLDEQDQESLARSYLRRQLFQDMLGSTEKLDGSGGCQFLVTQLQTIFCRRLLKRYRLPQACVVFPSFLNNRQLPIQFLGVVEATGRANVTRADVDVASLPSMRIHHADDRIIVTHSDLDMPFEVELRDYVKFIYEKLRKLDPINLIERSYLEPYAARELKLQVHDLFEFGPLTKFFDANLRHVTDVSLDVSGGVFISVNGAFFPIGERLHAYAIEKAVLKIKSCTQVQFDATHPFLNADVLGVRVSCTHPSISSTYQITLRRKSTIRFTLGQLRDNGSFPAWVKRLLVSIINSKKNLIVSGGLGSGKTSLLAALLGAFGSDKKIASIEDTREIELIGQHHSPLLTRPGVTEQQLLESVLRSAADVIAVGEIRNPQAADAMVKALNTGQTGLSTIHSNSAEDSIARLTNLLVAGGGVDMQSARQDISSAIDFIIHMKRIGGRRQISQLLEIGRLDEQTGEIVARPILEADLDGQLRFTGVLPSCIEALCKNGFEIPCGRELF